MKNAHTVTSKQYLFQSGQEPVMPVRILDYCHQNNHFHLVSITPWKIIFHYLVELLY